MFVHRKTLYIENYMCARIYYTRIFEISDQHLHSDPKQCNELLLEGFLSQYRSIKFKSIQRIQFRIISIRGQLVRS